MAIRSEIRFAMCFFVLSGGDRYLTGTTIRLDGGIRMSKCTRIANRFPYQSSTEDFLGMLASCAFP